MYKNKYSFCAQYISEPELSVKKISKSSACPGLDIFSTKFCQLYSRRTIRVLYLLQLFFKGGFLDVLLYISIYSIDSFSFIILSRNSTSENMML